MKSPFVRIALVVAALMAVALPAPATGPQATVAASPNAQDAGLRRTLGVGLGQLPNFANRSAKLVRLQVGAFDPLAGPAPSPAGIALVNEATLAPGVAQHFLVQVQNGRFADAAQAIAAAGGTIDGYVPDDTYLVRATPAQRAVLNTSPAIRWTGFYQPAWRVPVAVNGVPGVLDKQGPQAYRVYSFRQDPQASTLASRLAAIPGVRVADNGGLVVDVLATAAQVPAMAAIPFVQWVTLQPAFIAMNKEARWVTDSGIRDLYWATAPNGTTPARLSGAGQTTADADTAINYIPDQNGRAQADVRDCSDPAGTICKLADYTQVTPGFDTDSITKVAAHNPGAPHRKMAAYFDIAKAGVNPPDPDAHGTHTSGTITGDAGTYGQYDGQDGMAPAARLVFQNISTPSGGLTTPTDYYQLFRQAYHPSDPGSVAVGTVDPTAPSGGSVPCDCATGASYKPLQDARTHNNSYGTGIPVSLGEAGLLDQFVWDHEDMAISTSAGNSGPGAGTIDGDPGTAKNNFTSGATSNGRQPMVSIDSLTNFSSHGPTPDGRFGVTVVTPGEVLISAKGGTTDGYHYAQGTSMSSPVLTGALTLMRQYFWDGYGPAFGKGVPGGTPNVSNRHNPSAALLKASAVNGAERLRGYYTGDDGSKLEANLRGQYPSAGQGFGRLNLSNSLYFQNDPVNDWYYDVYRADPEAFQVSGPNAPIEKTYTIKVTEAGSPLAISMAYTDAPNALGVGTSSLVNNLDLTVTGPNGTYVGNNFNTRTTPSADEAETPAGQAAPDVINNVEKVRIASAPAGTYTVTVRGTAIALGPQGFALAAHGKIADGQAASTFVAGPERQHDTTPGQAPTISNVKAEPVSADLVKVTFDTNEPTTATAAGKVVTENHTFTDVYNLGPDGYYGLPSNWVETSDRFANKPVVGTQHEIYLTGFTAGAARTFTLSATDLEGKPSADTPVSFTTPDNVFQPLAPDQGQLSNPDNPGFTWKTGKQFYAGSLDGSSDLGAFMFRLPSSVNPADITGATVELTAAHDWVNQEKDDSVFSVDLLPDAVKANWGTQTYADIHASPAAATAAPETTYHRGGGLTYAYTFSCADLGALKSSLGTEVAGQRLAPFRWDTHSPQSSGVWSAEFGYNRRSRGLEFRPKLVLNTKTSSAQPPLTACDPNAPAPAISDIGLHPGAKDNSMTVTWHTDVLSNSVVLFRQKGATDWTQVGTDARTVQHQVELLNIDKTKPYEFGVRSIGCNGASTTDDNAGAGYDFQYPPPPAPRTTYWFHGTNADQVNRAQPPGTATFNQTAPTGTASVLQATEYPTSSTWPTDPRAVYWEATVDPAHPFTAAGDMRFDLWASSPEPDAAAPTYIEINVFADVDNQTPSKNTPIGTTVVTLNGISTTPAPYTATIGDIKGTATKNLVVQIRTPYINTGHIVRVDYDSTAMPSSFSIPAGPPTPWKGAHTSAGPYPPVSAGASNLNLASVPTHASPTPADVAAGTGMCAAPSVVSTPPPPPAPASTPGEGGGGSTALGPQRVRGYRMSAADGGVFSFGDASFRGSMGGMHLNQPIVGLAATPSGNGYWLAARDGGIFAFGDARFLGSMGGTHLNQPIVGLASTPTGLGYWLVAKDGGIFAFGDARFHGSTAGQRLRAPIVGMATTPSGNGYWLVASDGGVFTFGDAPYRGAATGSALRSPIVGVASPGTGDGYWLVAADGGVFSFGDAGFQGSTAGGRLASPIVGIAPAGSNGYWLVAADGGVFSFGDAPFRGSAGGLRLTSPVNSMAA